MRGIRETIYEENHLRKRAENSTVTDRRMLSRAYICWCAYEKDMVESENFILY